MTTIATRLRETRLEKDWTQEVLAKKSGVSQGTIGNIESGARRALGSLPRIAEALGVRHNWLRDGDLPKLEEIQRATVLVAMEEQAVYTINLQNNPDYPAIKRVKFKLSAGVSGFAVDYDQGDNTPLVFNRSWYENNNYTPAKLFAVSVSNGSMEPGLHHDDVVVVNTDSITPKDGKVFAVNYEGEMVIKRMVRDAGQWWLRSDNPDQGAYPRKVCDEHCIIIGEVVQKQSETI